MLRIDVNNSQQLQAILLAVKQAERVIRKSIRQQTKATVSEVWRETMVQNAETLLEHRVLVANATVLISDQNVRLRTATKGRKLRGGLNPKENYAGVEFGADRDVYTEYTATSRKGKTYKVKRRTRSQLRPRNKSGYVFGPAVAEAVPRIASLWAQTVVRVMAEALEGKSDG